MQLPKFRFKYATVLEEAERIFAFRERLSSSNNSTKNCYNLALPKELIKKLASSNSFKETKDLILVFVRKNIPAGNPTELQKASEFFNEVSETYIKELCLLTDNELSFKEYECIVIRAVIGHYIENSNKVYTNISFGYKPCVAICCEEILHLHYWQTLKKLFKLDKSILISKYGIMPWKISEIIPEYILVNNPKLEQFGFNKWNRALSYPWIIDMKKTADKIWRQRKNFKDFLINIHKQFNCPIG